MKPISGNKTHKKAPIHAAATTKTEKVETKQAKEVVRDTLIRGTTSGAELNVALSALGPLGPTLSDAERQELVSTLSGLKSDDPEVNALIDDALGSLTKAPELPGHLAVLTDNGNANTVQATLVRQRREGGAIAYVVRPRDPSVAPYELEQSIGQSLMPKGSPTSCAVVASLDASGSLKLERDTTVKSRFMGELEERDGVLGASLPSNGRFMVFNGDGQAGDVVDLKIEGESLISLKTFAKAGTPESQLYKVALERGLDPSFSPEIEAEVAALVKSPGLDDKGLRDLSELPFVTIDNDDSKDLDQAMHIERREDGGYDLYYALADASHYIQPGTALFDEAVKRSSTYYFPGFSVPMLPRELSEDVVSLNPAKDGLSDAQERALKSNAQMSDLMKAGKFDQTELLDMGFRRSMVFKISLDKDGKNPSTEVFQAAIRSRAKLSYNGVQASHDGEVYPGKGQPEAGADYSETLKLLEELGEKRISAAEARGVVHFNRTNVKVAIGGAENGEHRFMLLNEARNQVEKWNEQISLLCNSEGGRLLKEHSESGFGNLQAIFRVHDSPPEGRLRQMERCVNTLCEEQGLGDEFRWKRDEQSLADFIHNLPRGTDRERRLFLAIQRQAIMTNVASNFEAEASGHHGVGAEAYARFSSPMREMVGIFTHKELLEVLNGDRQLGPQDRQLQKEVIDSAMAAKSLQKKVNKEANKLAISALFERQLELPPDERERFKGTVMGFDRNKMYVQLDDPPIEVKVYLSKLQQATGDKFRIHDSSAYASNGDSRVSLGDAIDVSCVEMRDGRFILRPQS